MTNEHPTHDADPAAERPASLAQSVQARLAAVHNRECADLIVMANEISFAHGTGVLMSRVLEEAPPYVLLRAFDHWGGTRVVKPLGEFVLHRYSEERQVIARFAAMRASLYDIRNIISIPYTREDVVMALTVKAMTGAPLSIWIMDDNSVLNDGIPANLMTELIEAADARFVISDGMRGIYESHHRRPFWVLPPLVARRFMRAQPSRAASHDKPRGCIVGNIWHQAWLEDMSGVLNGTGVEIDWFTSSKDLHFLSIDERRLADAGVTIRSELSHREIADRIVESAFVLVPSASGSETDGHAAAIGRLSLPSKMPFVTASAGTPFVVLANETSGAADYVERFDLGAVCRYQRQDCAEAIARVTDPAEQQRIRETSFGMSDVLDVTGTYPFLLSAARHRRLPNDRFERAFSSVSAEGRSVTNARL